MSQESFSFPPPQNINIVGELFVVVVVVILLMCFNTWKTFSIFFFVECNSVNTVKKKMYSPDKKVVSPLNNSPFVKVELWTQLGARGGISHSGLNCFSVRSVLFMHSLELLSCSLYQSSPSALGFNGHFELSGAQLCQAILRLEGWMSSIEDSHFLT